ncbi:hypothetical protein RB213_015624, partial [Colletotrichum asianum]
APSVVQFQAAFPRHAMLCKTRQVHLGKRDAARVLVLQHCPRNRIWKRSLDTCAAFHSALLRPRHHPSIAAGPTDPRNRCDAACPANLYTNLGILVWLAYIHAPIASAQELDTFLLLPDTTQAYQPEHTQPPFLHEKTTPRPQVTMIDQRQHTLFDRKACVAFQHGMIPSSIIRIQHPPSRAQSSSTISHIYECDYNAF